jgi:hypothetical protein
LSLLAANTQWDLVSHKIDKILDKSLLRGGSPHRTSQFCMDELDPDFRDMVSEPIGSIVGFPASSTLQAHWVGLKGEGVR